MSLIKIEFIKSSDNEDDDDINCENYEQALKVEQLSDIEEECEQKPNKTELTENTKYNDDDYKAKCGEIFVSNSGKMHFACLFCDLTFNEAEHFRNHVFKQHLNLEEDEEECDDSDADDPMSDDHSPNLSDDGEDNEDYDIVSEDIGDFKIIDGEYTTVSALDEDPIKAEPVVQLNQTSGNKDFIEHFRNFLDDTLYGSTTPESENDNNSPTPPASTETKKKSLSTSRKTEIVDPDLYCEICDKQFRTKRGIVNHKVRHEVIASNDVMLSDYHDSDDDDESKPKSPIKTVENSLKCRYCSKQFKDTTKRIYHERIHTGEKPFKCKICGNTFRSNRLLDCHMRVHTGERPFLCPHCPAKFAHKMNMIVHIRAHLGIKRFGCDVCGKRFVRNVDKTIHLRTHTGEKPYQCETCGTSFSTSSKLKEHIKRHTNTKPYQCQICSKYFYSKALLKNHQPTHSDERPFECSLCDAKFPRKRAMQCHMKIHSDVKEYVCNICGKGFSQNAGLYCHMKTHGHKPGIKSEELEYISDGGSYIM